MTNAAKKPTADEFRWLDDNTLEHSPTGARFTRKAMDAGLLTTLLGDGLDYDVEQVLDLAWRLTDAKGRAT